ncbi:hypothetical protein KQI69_02385, partial [Eubacterium sp. MSJ-13]|uniref:hypothetical protein n=1 Tax=Eubacterium sp. MSJ-13 TaxID=2841513 RepID=UPI001C118E56
MTLNIFVKELASDSIGTQGYAAAMNDNIFSVVFGYYADYKVPVNGTIYCFEINLSTMQGNLKSYPNITEGDIYVGTKTLNRRYKPFFITKNYF